MKEKHIFREDYFRNIDTEDKAYWLGFILADGYINKNDNTIGIELKSDEIKHLEKFKECLGSNKEVKIYNKNSTFGKQQNCRFCFANKESKQDLLNLGITSTKTYDGIMPTIREDLVRHMIRGYFDGDGSFSLRELKRNHGYNVHMGITSTKEILKEIEKHSGFTWTWSQRRPERNTNNYSIGCGRQKDCRNFLDYIYKDCNIYLDRKYEKYLFLKEEDLLSGIIY